ncbi:MAG: hypothetical protein ACYSTL_04795 [Planctomycetota bacterium]|jgi:hypothetical protein
MRKSISQPIIWATALLLVIVCTPLREGIADSAVTRATGHVESSFADLVETWGTVRNTSANSRRFAQARKQLLEMIEQLGPAEKAAAATALMDRSAPDNINVAALALFGRDPLSDAEIRDILFNEKRSFRQRVLLRTYFALIRREYQTSQLTDQAKLRLVQILTERIEVLSGKQIGYGEQRLLTHLCQSVLSRYAKKGDEYFQVRWFIEALNTYALGAPQNDIFALSVRGWFVLMDRPGTSITSVVVAMASLGHWDPLVRWRASQFLSRQAEGHPDITTKVWEAVSDPRDEVRAEGVAILAVLTDIEPQRLVGKLVDILTRDRGVVVQAAAAVALARQVNRAEEALEPLLKVFDLKAGSFLPGPSRTSSIMSALAKLVIYADNLQRQEMLELALAKLSVAPTGALELLKALGPAARSAIPDLQAYRNEAGRTHRQYIERHVLPAIAYGIPDRGEK